LPRFVFSSISDIAKVSSSLPAVSVKIISAKTSFVFILFAASIVIVPSASTITSKTSARCNANGKPDLAAKEFATPVIETSIIETLVSSKYSPIASRETRIIESPSSVSLKLT